MKWHGEPCRLVNEAALETDFIPVRVPSQQICYVIRIKGSPSARFCNKDAG